MTKIYSIRYHGIRKWGLISALSLKEAQEFALFLGRCFRYPDWAIQSVKVRPYRGVPKRLPLVRSIILSWMSLDAAAE